MAKKSSIPSLPGSASSTKPKTKKKQPMLLLRKAEHFFLMPEKMIENMPPAEVFQLALAAHKAQRIQLMEDARKGDHFVHNIKIVDGLEKSLTKLEKLYPSIREQIALLDHDASIGQA